MPKRQPRPGEQEAQAPVAEKQPKDKRRSRLAVPPSIPVADVSLGQRLTGRPPKLVENAETLERIKQLAGLQLTQVEAAGVMLVAVSTFKAFLQKSALAREAWEIGEGSGKASVKRAQFVMAHRSATMAIWWGKQHLGQSDKVETENNHSHEYEWIDSSAQDFDRRMAGLAARAAKAPGPERAH